MKTNTRLVLIALIIGFAVSATVQAQANATDSKPSTEFLSSLPESEMVVYVNASRILNDAMPRLVPEKELQKMRDGMDQIKALTNVDLRHLEYIVIAMRFNKPSGTMMFPIPEAMFEMHGDFDAKAFLAMAVTMSGGVLREEKFGEHTIYVLKLSDVAKGAAGNPLGSAFSEMAFTALDGNTLAVGNTGYIKSALDATDGRGRIKPETIASLLRDPAVLISSTGSPLVAFAKSFGLKIAESRDPTCMTRFGEYFLSITMGNTDFKINGAMNADNPETAVLIKNMLSGLVKEGKEYVPDKSAQSLFDQVKLIAEGNEVLLETTIPQEMVIKSIRDFMAPAPPTKPVLNEPKKEPAPSVEKHDAEKGKSTTKQNQHRN